MRDEPIMASGDLGAVTADATLHHLPISSLARRRAAVVKPLAAVTPQLARRRLGNRRALSSASAIAAAHESGGTLPGVHPA